MTLKERKRRPRRGSGQSIENPTIVQEHSIPLDRCQPCHGAELTDAAAWLVQNFSVRPTLAALVADLAGLGEAGQ